LKENQAALMGKNNSKPAIYVAMELSRKKWKLAFSDGNVMRARIVTIDARDWEGYQRELGSSIGSVWIVEEQ